MTLAELVDALPIWARIAIGGTLGAIFGSFIAALSDRWPSGESIVNGRSSCPACGETLRSYELVPILSYLAQRGKCRRCRAPIGVGSIVIETAAAIIGAASLVLFTGNTALAFALLGWLLLPLIVLDIRHFWLPDRITVLVAIAGAICGGLLSDDTPLVTRAIAAVLAFAAMEALRRGYRYLRGRDGMGAGDPKLLGAIAFWTSPMDLPLLILIAATLGIADYLIRMRKAGQEAATQLPFGAYLCVSAMLVIATPAFLHT